MSVELIKYAFVAGEVSPTLYGRTDLTKYDFGMALAKNWFVDYRGGLSTRAGTEFLDWTKDGDPRAFEFQFSPDEANTYYVLFGDNYVRFMQAGGYVLEDELTVSGATAAEPPVLTVTAHGLDDDDWVKVYDVGGMTELNSRTFSIQSVDADHITLHDPISGADIDATDYTAYTSGGKVARIYEIESPYSDADLPDLGYEQVRDTVRLTRWGHPVRNLVRHDHADWEFTEEQIGNDEDPPTSLFATASGSGTAATAYAVSAIMADGTETIPCIPILVDNMVNFTVEEGSVTVSWAAKAGAKEYIVYRTIVVSSGPVNAGTQMGFLTRTFGTSFTDSNVVPDFSKSPYEHNNPFAVSAIDEITITNPGSGYSFVAPMDVTGSPGTGFFGYGIVDAFGAITAIKILRRGSGYVDPIVSFTGGGADAEATATTTPASGTDPAVSCIFQQRQIYAATENDPLILFGSRVRSFSNFDISISSVASDSYEYEIDSTQVTPIRFLFPTRGGLFVMTAAAISLLNSDSSGPVTNSNAQSDPQTWQGVANVRPLRIGGDLLYIESRGNAVRLLSYSELSKNYGGADQSILSNHLFGAGREITSWAFTENPHKLVQAVRADGALLLFTLVKEQEVFAWTWAQTRGFFKDVVSIRGESYDQAYYIVRRFINGYWRNCIERQAVRDFTRIEDAWCVDCGLRLEPPLTDDDLEISPEYLIDGEKYVDLTGDLDDTEGYWVRAAGGIFVIREVTVSGALAKVIVSATDLIPEDPEGRVAPITSWSISPTFTSIEGLWHLEGEEVSILGDGSVFPKQTVTNGKIELSDGVSKCLVGLGFSAQARTLPPTVTDVPIEARRKRVMGIGIRLSETRGLKVGRELANLYEFHERTTELYSSPTFTMNGMKYKVLQANWDTEGQTYFVQDNPLPATLLGLVPDMEIGDDPD